MHKFANKAKNLYSQYDNWDDLEKAIGINLPRRNGAEYTYLSVRTAADLLVYDIEGRAERELDSPPEDVIKLSPIYANRDRPIYGEIQLYPEQQPVANEMYRQFVEYLNGTSKSKAFLDDGKTGCGKTFEVAHFIARILSEGIIQRECPLPLANILIICPKPVKRQYCEVLEKFGLKKYLHNIIYITTYSELRSRSGAIFCKIEDVEDEFDGTVHQEVTINKGIVPLVVILDESHKLQNEDALQTRIINAFLECKRPPFELHCSATPFITVNSARSLILAIDNVKLLGIKITADNFRQLAPLITPEPHRASKVGAKRLRKILSPYILTRPRVKWAHKAINDVVILDFLNDHQRSRYARAEQTYVEKCRRLGKDPASGTLGAFVILNEFRRTVEPIRGEQVSDIVASKYREGLVAPVVACAYRNTINSVVLNLVKKHGIPREEIAIIWGGRRKFRRDILMNKAECAALARRIAAGDDISYRELRALKETIVYEQDAIEHGEIRQDDSVDEDAHNARLDTLDSLQLSGSQSSKQRYENIQAFQTGEAKICIYTIASGGTGLSLDHDKPSLLPREVWITPIYSGIDFKQGLGRTVRRATLSDTWQHVCLMRGTVEEHHVAPLLDTKMAALANSVNEDYTLELMKKILASDLAEQKQINLRTVDQVLADSDKDGSQMYEADDVDSDDEDDDEDADNNEE